jgi:hypothetical protein
VSKAPFNFWSRISVSFSGRLAQLNISLLFLVGLIVALGYLVQKSNNYYLATGGTITLLVVAGYIVWKVLNLHSRQEPRPEGGKQSSFELESNQGVRVRISNPPDKLFTDEQGRAFLRGMLVGYDASLCPDGKVIGQASEQNVELYDEKAKQEFVAKHKAEIEGKKILITSQLELGTFTEPKSVPENRILPQTGLGEQSGVNS